MKLNQTHFYKFRQSIIYYFNKFIDKSWNYDLVWREPLYKNGKLIPATTGYNYDKKTITFKLATEWEMPPTDNNLDFIAKHEVIHCLFIEVDYIQKTGGSRTRYLEEQEKLTQRISRII